MRRRQRGAWPSAAGRDAAVRLWTAGANNSDRRAGAHLGRPRRGSPRQAAQAWLTQAGHAGAHPGRPRRRGCSVAAACTLRLHGERFPADDSGTSAWLLCVRLSYEPIP
eukprot:363717-Chlamydomonas_euryale.AAC.6